MRHTGSNQSIGGFLGVLKADIIWHDGGYLPMFPYRHCNPSMSTSMALMPMLMGLQRVHMKQRLCQPYFSIKSCTCFLQMCLLWMIKVFMNLSSISIHPTLIHISYIVYMHILYIFGRISTRLKNHVRGLEIFTVGHIHKYWYLDNMLFGDQQAGLKLHYTQTLIHNIFYIIQKSIFHSHDSYKLS